MMNWEILGNIFEGWKNLIFQSKEVEEVAVQRINICSSCPIRTDGFCDNKKVGESDVSFNYQGIQRHKKGIYKGCGCVIEAKVRCLECKCSLGKW